MHNDNVRTLQIGYMPLIDCAPLVAAVRLGLDRKYGLRLQLQRQASWAAIRDKLLSGELDAVHALMGLVYGVETGIAGAMIGRAAMSAPWIFREIKHYVATGAFLPHDLHYLGMSSDDLCDIASCRVVDFMIHDRAAFGGTLVGLGVLYVWVTAFPLSRGDQWAWWVWLISGPVGFASFLSRFIVLADEKIVA